MKMKVVYVGLIIGLLSACSSDNIVEPVENVDRIQLSDAGLNLPAQDPHFVIPNIPSEKEIKGVDLRPPVIPMPLIPNSQAYFDNNKVAFILYPISQQRIYNLSQVARVLNDQHVKTELKNNSLFTDWINYGEDKNISIKYEIRQDVKNQTSGLYVWIKDIKINNELVEPTLEQSKRYTVTLLNEVIGNLTRSYQQQKKALTH